MAVPCSVISEITWASTECDLVLWQTSLQINKLITANVEIIFSKNELRFGLQGKTAAFSNGPSTSPMSKL